MGRGVGGGLKFAAGLVSLDPGTLPQAACCWSLLRGLAWPLGAFRPVLGAVSSGGGQGHVSSPHLSQEPTCPEVSLSQPSSQTHRQPVRDVQRWAPAGRRWLTDFCLVSQETPTKELGRCGGEARGPELGSPAPPLGPPYLSRCINSESSTDEEGISLH